MMKFFSVITLCIAFLGGAGCWFVISESRSDSDNSDFVQQKIEILENENQRLRTLVEGYQSETTRQNDSIRREEIQEQVTQIRGLALKRPVKFRKLGRDQFPALVLKMIGEQYSDEELTAMTDGYIALGLVPGDFDLKQTYVELLAEQVAAFYDQHSAQLFTFDGTPLDSMENRIILAHELTHALQDQHFTLADLPLEEKGNDDRAIAASALVEGDATILMSQYMINNLDPSELGGMLGTLLTQDLEQLNNAPAILRESLLFPYVQGQVFCEALYARGGFDAIDKAYANPPSASSLILHPELYLSDPEWRPVEIEWSGESVNPDGYEVVATNVLGEFGLKVWLSKTGAVANAGASVAGWQGDSYRALRNASGDLGYVSQTVWDDAESAERFHGAVTAHLAALHGDEVAAKGRDVRVEMTDGHRVVVADLPAR